MICPKCGSTIQEGHLYCETCGEEIRIVPDFDATVDENINISFTDEYDTAGVIQELSKVATKEIAKEIDIEATKEININSVKHTSIDRLDDKKPDDKIVIKALVIAGAVCLVIVFLVLMINRRINDYYSIDKQYEKAFDYFESEQYDESVKILKHAHSIDSEDIRISILLSDNYYMLGKYDESNAVLYELINQNDDPNIYERIIKNYEALNDYSSISKLLNDINDEEILNIYKQYKVSNVSFSVESGVYDSKQTVVLSSDEESTIYYTLDGQNADENALLYNGPIELEAGEYIINAVAINKFGVKSENTIAEYTIDYFVPDAPIIKTTGGTYNVPTPIEADFADYEVCYYTIDGEDPTIEDEKYIGPIPMYIGKHTYKFAVISNKGVSSDVVSVDISLEMVVLLDMETATNAIISWKKLSGNTDYSYKCEQACVTNNSTYYIINEYDESDEEKEPTGNHYAVDVLNGLSYKAILNKSTGEYTLEALR